MLNIKTKVFLLIAILVIIKNASSDQVESVSLFLMYFVRFQFIFKLFVNKGFQRRRQFRLHERR